MLVARWECDAEIAALGVHSHRVELAQDLYANGEDAGPIGQALTSVPGARPAAIVWCKYGAHVNLRDIWQRSGAVRSQSRPGAMAATVHFRTGKRHLANSDKIGGRDFLESEISNIRLRLLELKSEQIRLDAALANL
jgi:hypothetical protein